MNAEANFTKQQVDALLGQGGDVREFTWAFPTFPQPLPASINLANPAEGVLPKTVETLNDLLRIGESQRDRIRKLLFEAAMRARESAAYGDPDAPKIPLKKSLWEKFTGQAPALHFVAIDVGDPQHPCHFRDGVNGVDEKVKYTGWEITEDDTCQHRFAVLHCYPQWEEEHGARIILRNGEPVAVTDYPEDFASYDSI